MESEDRLVDWRKVAIFTVLVMAMAVVIGSIPVILHIKFQGTAATVIGSIYMLFPALVAIFVAKVLYHQAVINPLKISFRLNRWFLAGWLIPLLAAVLAMLFGLLMPGVTYSPDMAGMFERYRDILTADQLAQMKESIDQLPVHPIYITIVQGLVAGATINAFFAFGEELGWRGFLLQELKPLGFFRASLLIGLIWGLWHSPLILQGYNYPQHPVAGVFMMILFCILYTPLLNFITLKANSVVAAAIMHGTINGLAGVAFMLLQGGSDLTVGITGAAGLIALLLLNVCLYVGARDYLNAVR